MRKLKNFFFAVSIPISHLIIACIVLTLIIHGCGTNDETAFNEKENIIVVTFNNNPLSKPGKHDTIDKNFNKLDIPLAKIEPQIVELFLLVKKLQEGETDPKEEKRIIEVKMEILDIIMENISLFHLRNNGLPIDVRIK